MAHTKYTGLAAATLAQLHALNLSMTGICFAIVVEVPNKMGRIEQITYPRINQPCYGELRKYKSIHGKECTQPDTIRPSDLYSPFPDGKPVGLAVGFDDCSPDLSEISTRFTDYVFGASSPWVRGFGKPSNIEWTKENGKRRGFILKSLDIDPTVLVNLMKHLQTTISDHDQPDLQTVEKLLNKGVPFEQAINCGVVCNFVSGMVCQPNTYIYPGRVDLRRVIEGDPHDLTGGTLAGRFDYNRKDLALIFKGSFNFMKAMSKYGEINRYGQIAMTGAEFLSAYPKVWEEGLAVESVEAEKKRA